MTQSVCFGGEGGGFEEEGALGCVFGGCALELEGSGVRVPEGEGLTLSVRGGCKEGTGLGSL